MTSGGWEIKPRDSTQDTLDASDIAHGNPPVSVGVLNEIMSRSATSDSTALTTRGGGRGVTDGDSVGVLPVDGDQDTEGEELGDVDRAGVEVPDDDGENDEDGERDGDRAGVLEPDTIQENDTLLDTLNDTAGDADPVSLRDTDND